MIIADDSGPRPAPKSWSRMPTTDCRLLPTDCYPQTARYLQSCSYLYQRRWGGSCKLANQRTANCCTTTIQYNCIADYNSKIHMLKIYNEQK